MAAAPLDWPFRIFYRKPKGLAQWVGILIAAYLFGISPRFRSFKRCSSCPPGGHDQRYSRHRVGIDLLVARPGAGDSHAYGRDRYSLHRGSVVHLTKKS